MFEFSYHPSKQIVGTKGSLLKGKTICLCLTGSVAVTTAPIIAREFMRLGAEVICVMSRAACELITPALMEWATGNRVITGLTGAVEHVHLAGETPRVRGKADVILVCPATANTISKIAVAIDDTPVTTVVTTAFGSGTPIIVVPAMHESMYRHPILEENLLKLRQRGVEILLPRILEGKAKIARVDQIVDRVADIIVIKKDLRGLNFLVTAGPGREYIDSVRFISNPSSGKMGMAIAEEILARGGQVTIINGHSEEDPPIGANVVNVTSAQDFLDQTKAEMHKQTFDFFVSAAAIADFTPESEFGHKISSSADLVLKLKPTPKLIEEVRRLKPDITIVAFKAETGLTDQELVEKAYMRLNSSGADLIVANNVSRHLVDQGFASETNTVFIITPEHEVTHIEMHQKRYIASQLIDKALATHILKKKKSAPGNS